MNLFPTQNQAQFAPAGLAALSLTAACELDASDHLRGATHLDLSATLELTEHTSIAGQAAALQFEAEAFLRIGDEPNVFLEGNSQLNFAATADVAERVEIAGASGLTFVPALNLTQTQAEEFGFTIFLTVIDSVVQAAASGRMRRYSTRLTIDGVEVPFSSFSLPGARDALGSQLSVTLARSLRSQLSAAASYKFEIALWAGGAWRWQTILDSGTLAGRDYSISFQPGKPVGRPSDSLTFSTINSLANRWQLAPRQPVTLFDPERVDLDTDVDPSYAIRTERGEAILPAFEQHYGLSLLQVLARAYVQGCRFAGVRTNIPDFPVKRADFSMSGGWHDGAAPLVAPFEPLYFPGENDTLWIIERGAPLPAGFQASTLTADDYVEVRDSEAAQLTTNALIVIYQEDGGDYFTTRFDQETIERGHFGDLGYTRTEVTRKIREYRNTANPATIVREVVEETKTEVINHLLEAIHRETQVDQFDALGRKTGHTRTAEALLPTIEAGQTALLPVTNEQCSISYRPNPFHPSESVLDATVTYVSGLILSDNDNLYLGQPFKIPIVDAHRNGFIDLGTDQERLNVPIKTTIESLRVRGDGQVEVYTLVLDHLANTSERSDAQPRVGAVSFNARGGLTKQVLLTIPGTELDGRRVPTFNAGELPADIALALGRRRLARLNAPPPTLLMEPVGIDFSLRRGSVRTILDRDGNSLGTYMIDSVSLSGSHQGENNFQLRMTVTGEKVADS